MVLNIYPFVFAIVLGIVSYIADDFCVECSGHKRKVVSFISGILVAYMFLQLLPELYAGTLFLNRTLFVFALAGFVTYRLVEMYTYAYLPATRIKSELLKEHEAVLFMDHTIFGVLLVSTFLNSFVQGLLFFIPIMFLDIMLSAPIYHHFSKKGGAHASRIIHINLFHSFAPFLGVALATLLQFSVSFNFGMVAFLSGMILYIVIRELIPPEKEGVANWFILGIIFYGIILGSAMLFAG